MEPRQQFAPLSTLFAWSNTTAKLHEQFGWPGVVAWVYMIAAAKRGARSTPGEVVYTSDIDLWQQLGMDSDPPGFSADELFHTLGRQKQTRRRRSGRVTYVTLTNFGRWNETDKRWREAERKRRKREESAADKKRTASGHVADKGRTPAGHDPDASAPLTTNLELKDVKEQDHSLLGVKEEDGAAPPPTDADVPFDLNEAPFEFPDVLVKPMPD